MPPRARKASAATGHVLLLDGNVLVALVNAGHVHHEAAQRWFETQSAPFATCPITQGTLLRLLIRLGALEPVAAAAVLTNLVGHPSHRFWPDALGYDSVAWSGVMGHRQVTDAYLAALARHHGGRLATFDRGLVALHGDVAVEIADR